MTREEKEQIGKYVLQMARLLEDGCYQQEMLLKAVHIIDEALEQEPRKGHWKSHGRGYEKIYMCDNCKKESLQRGNYCPNCGADMREVKESEG